MVITQHPKLVERWARRYIHLYRKEGPDKAKDWALSFLPPPDRKKMIERVNELTKRKGPNQGA